LPRYEARRSKKMPYRENQQELVEGVRVICTCGADMEKKKGRRRCQFCDAVLTLKTVEEKKMKPKKLYIGS